MIITEGLKKTFKLGLQKRLTIDGKTQTYNSYFVPLKYLFFNNLNGRISTYIEEYNDNPKNSNLSELLKTNLDEYNNLIGDFIKKSSNDNESSFKKTKDDIYKKGQQNPGVILSDGRIIDGNRRFTAIRELYNETGDDSFAYFETVILEVPELSDKEGWKRIKTLELFLQFNVDEKKDYNRIDFLVSFYKDTMDPDTRIFDDKKQYTYASGISSSNYDKNVSIVQIMLDYLEWRNKPKAFYILKNEKLDGPIEDIASATKKMNIEEWNSIKDYIYFHMTLSQGGDKTREIRELLKSAKTNGKMFSAYKEQIDKNNIFLKLTEGVQIKDSIPSNPEESQSKNQTLNNLSSILNNSYKIADYSIALDKMLTEPIEILDTIIDNLDKFDKSILNKENELVIEKLNTIGKKVQELIDKNNGAQ